MSLQHFFLDSQVLKDVIECSNNSGFELDLSSEDYKHAMALRLSPKEHIGVIDADGVFYECEILSLDKKLFVKNAKRKTDKIGNNFDICLCPALPKGNKLDDVIRACTEIGVSGFMPFISSRCVTKLDNKKEGDRQARWQKIAKSAAMQSGRMSIPTIHSICDLEKICNLLINFDCVYVCWEEATDTSGILEISLKLKKSRGIKKVAIIVGPEGGLSCDEVAKLTSCNDNSHVVSLGSSILRTQTADIVAPAIVKYLLSC